MTAREKLIQLHVSLELYFQWKSRWTLDVEALALVMSKAEESHDGHPTSMNEFPLSPPFMHIFLK